jgi:hypothetical protein
MMTSPIPEPATASPVGERTVRRIAFLIPLFGAAGGLLTAALHRLDWSEGVLLGSGLAWLNFRWLRRGIEAFTSASSGRVGAEKPRPSGATYLAALLRYALIGFAVYVIFAYLHAPLVSIALGLCAFAAATITASVWEILQSVKKRS